MTSRAAVTVLADIEMLPVGWLAVTAAPSTGTDEP